MLPRFPPKPTGVSGFSYRPQDTSLQLGLELLAGHTIMAFQMLKLSFTKKDLGFCAVR
uniref:Uncharacterized protein n=1 Tax=Anguilla anguilla TaxID=7936 RepID=A0A0E9RG24_ANGAN